MREENCSNILADLVCFVEEDDDMGVERLLEDILLLYDVFNQSQQASLRIVPCVSSKLFTSRV